MFKPVFKSVPQDQAVREGTCVRLDCVIAARPSPDVTWLRNGQPVQQDDLHKVCLVQCIDQWNLGACRHCCAGVYQFIGCLCDLLVLYNPAYFSTM